MRRSIYLCLFLGLYLSACRAKPDHATITYHPAGPAWAALFQRQAAEYQALCLQAYNIATFRLKEKIKTTTHLPKAIITDIDETVLDNSPYFLREAKMGRGYNDSTWISWTAERKCDTLSGAVRFLKYAKANGVTIFYVTNRFDQERDATLDNLRRFNLPDADTAHLYTLGKDGSSKEKRRLKIQKDYSVILFLGDNLGDHSKDFDIRTVKGRATGVHKNEYCFGDNYIIFPNLMYGAWEDILYGPQASTNIEKNKSLGQLY